MNVPAGTSGSNSIKKLPCDHIFHRNCLRSWFQRQQTCPTCRTSILRFNPVTQPNNNNDQQAQQPPPAATHPPQQQQPETPQSQRIPSFGNIIGNRGIPVQPPLDTTFILPQTAFSSFLPPFSKCTFSLAGQIIVFIIMLSVSKCFHRHLYPNSTLAE